jgi:hypothetical protein
MLRRERCERGSAHGTPMVPPRGAGQNDNRLVITQAIIVGPVLSCLDVFPRKLVDFCTFVVHPVSSWIDMRVVSN